MADYISREAVEQVLRGIANGLSVGETEALKTKDLKALYKIQGAKEILNSVDNDLCFIPAADVQPVKRGHWEKLTIVPATDTGNCILARCSKCGDTVFYTVTGREITLKYCPNCGARMDLKDGDTND